MVFFFGVGVLPRETDLGRPLLLVGEAVGNGHEGHYVLGACIEIIHNFTLVHDDIMDQDPVRRGLKAVHVEFDEHFKERGGGGRRGYVFD